MAVEAGVDHARHLSASDQEARTRIKLPKKLVVCCDGTWMDSDNGWVKGSWGKPGHQQNASNVTRIARAVAPEDKHHHPQIVYYQAGVGTGVGLYNRLVGGGTGMGLAAHVREAYAFLVSNYAEHDKLVPNDSIFLVGFSRGAFTARTLGGFICAMGILKKKAMPHFGDIFEDWAGAGSGTHRPKFFENYFQHHHDVKEVHPDMTLAMSTDPVSRDQYLCQYFELLEKLDLSQNVHIKCIGVFDTVGALGIPVNPLLQRVFPFLPSFFRNYRWYDTRLDSEIKNAFHALALDERRFPFSPAVWERKDGCTSNLQQVWFPGAHSNVGGAYDDTGMSDISLAWMMDQLSGNSMDHSEDFRACDWLQFDDDYAAASYDCASNWREQHKKAPYVGWGRGKVYDSNTFLQTLLGQKTRVPGQYHRTIYRTGKTSLNTPLLDHTNEQIHSSVRARIDMGARGIEPEPIFVWLWRQVTGRGPRLYQPQRRDGPLHDWRLVDGHPSHHNPNWDLNMSPGGLEEIQWVFKGNGEVASRIMPEAKLGKYERLLLAKDQKIAKKMEFTNNRWHWFVEEDRRPPRGSTF
ncbi:hypothetical protein LTR08_000134 [Meristemomyces frigidus]|nr:hypothetical protein LTR08_000134 [Meristemomyces frigidus]